MNPWRTFSHLPALPRRSFVGSVLTYVGCRATRAQRQSDGTSAGTSL
mgnify:CR=1 FL=1